MSKRDDLIAKYAADLKEKCGVEPDMDFLTKVTIGCGPSIYNKDSASVAGSDKKELETVKNNFLIKKLGLADVRAGFCNRCRTGAVWKIKPQQAARCGVLLVG